MRYLVAAELDGGRIAPRAFNTAVETIRYALIARAVNGCHVRVYDDDDLMASWPAGKDVTTTEFYRLAFATLNGNQGESSQID